jgi:hypothetical protein
MISQAIQSCTRGMSAQSSAWARWPWVGGRVPISQNVCENKRRETCPRITTIFAFWRAEGGRNRQTRFGGKRRGGHILSKSHKIWLNQYF